MTAPFHGGRLREAAARTGIPLSEWLDLSTGINPNPWPVPELPPEVWHRLPEDDDGLIEVARAWAGAPADAGCVAVAGSQAAIQLLPQLRQRSRVGVPWPGYEEHAYRWREAGHDVVPLATAEIEEHLPSLDVLVVIQPNNPTGELLPVTLLQRWCSQLTARGGWLVVDEAFIDPLCPEVSMASLAGSDGLIVLRSLGKFFGLAGVRGGLVIGDVETCGALSQRLGPWAVSGAARWIMRQALSDMPWQQSAGTKLSSATQKLAKLLTSHGLLVEGQSLLFVYAKSDGMVHISGCLEQAGILVRCFDFGDQHEWIRFGLPGEPRQWERLASGLAALHTRD